MDQFSVLDSMRRVFAVIPPRRKIQGLIVLGFMLAGAFAELLTIGAVVPFLAIVSDPTYIEKHETLRALLSRVGVSAGPSAIVQLAILFCVVVCTAALIRVVLAWISQKYVFRIGYDLGVALFQRVIYQPYTWHVLTSSVNTVAAMNKLQQVISQSIMPVMQAASSLTIAVFIVGGLLFLNASVALLAIGSLGLLYAIVSVLARNRLRQNGMIISQAHTARLRSVQEGLGAIRDVIIDQSHAIYINKFAQIDTRLRDAQATNALIAATPRFLIEALGMVTIALLALYLSQQEGGLTSVLPVLGALALGAQRLLPLMQQTYNGFTAIASNKAALGSVLQLLDLPLPANLQMRKNLKALPFNRDITFEAVSFRYTEDGMPILSDISFTIRKGMRVGIVGETGSGKSTSLDLLMGLLTPTSGTIKVDGQALTPDNLPNWQVQIAHVPQQIYLRDTTLLENIAFGVPEADIDRERVYEAARRADIHEFIESLPKGYATVSGERGVRLSGGQRQRIGIARALYKDSTVLVLDEATSALDDRTEASIMDSIDRLGDGVTVLMIAHRVTTLRSCDVIFRLRKGRIEAVGSYQDVIEGAAGPVTKRQRSV